MLSPKVNVGLVRKINPASLFTKTNPNILLLV
jgi:hypothetical protein